MDGITFLFAGAAAAAAGYWLWGFRNRKSAPSHAYNRAFLVNYRFPAAVPAQVRKEWPDLSPEQIESVLGGLRDYFHLCGMARLKTVSMPSKAVDAAWHQFILDTREYGSFCRTVFGKFLHHFPAESMKGPTLADTGIKRTWRLACALDGIDRDKPDRLPRLFALDQELGIPDGFRYALDCSSTPRRQDALARDSAYAGTPLYCATHIGCTSCAGAFGSDDSHGSWSDHSAASPYEGSSSHHDSHGGDPGGGDSGASDSGGGGDSCGGGGCGGGGD